VPPLSLLSPPFVFTSPLFLLSVRADLLLLAATRMTSSITSALSKPRRSAPSPPFVLFSFPLSPPFHSLCLLPLLPDRRCPLLVDLQILEGVLGGASSTTTLVQGVESFIPLPALLTSTVTNVTTVLDGLTSDVTDNLDLTLVDDTLSGLTTDISTLTSLVATLKGDVGSVVESTLETVLVDLADLPVRCFPLPSFCPC
jgi:hypothetical protein